MRKVIIILAIAVSSASCSSGWSCQKRYVDATKVKLQKTIRSVDNLHNV